MKVTMKKYPVKVVAYAIGGGVTEAIINAYFNNKLKVSTRGGITIVQILDFLQHNVPEKGNGVVPEEETVNEIRGLAFSLGNVQLPLGMKRREDPMFDYETEVRKQ